ncbi:DinB family protein [Alkalihalobacillus sp. NPDC078783]
MFRTKADFLEEWAREKQLTLQVLESLTDEKLDQAIVEGHSSLGWLGWHLTTTIPFFASIAGVENVGNPSSAVPNQAKTIVDTYNEVSQTLLDQVENTWTDESFTDMVDFFGAQSPKGAVLRMLVSHQGHHRGQMTVLLRQAGLNVPGVYGPTIEQQS